MKKFSMYNGKIWGKEVSPYGKQNDRLDYGTLSQLVGDMILNNYMLTCDAGEWELENGVDQYAYDIDGNAVDLYDDAAYDYEPIEVYQTYIVSDRGAEVLKEYTDEIVYYNADLDMYLWGITHFGTSWDYVLTDIKLSDMYQCVY